MLSVVSVSMCTFLELRSPFLLVCVYIILFSTLYVYLMKCDLPIGAYDNCFSREAATHSGDHSDICHLAYSALELLKSKKYCITKEGKSSIVYTSNL